MAARGGIELPTRGFSIQIIALLFAGGAYGIHLVMDVITSKSMPVIGKLQALVYRSGFASTTTSATSPVPLSLTAASISEELHTTNQVQFIRPHKFAATVFN